MHVCLCPWCTVEKHRKNKCSIQMYIQQEREWWHACVTPYYIQIMHVVIVPLCHPLSCCIYMALVHPYIFKNFYSYIAS